MYLKKLWLKTSQIQDAQRTPNKMNPNSPIPRHIMIKMVKVRDKEQILKIAREKQRAHLRELPQAIS